VRFLLDESAELRLAALLRGLGHDVTTVVEDYPRAIDDDVVLSLARAEQRIVITNDLDFGELIFRQTLPHMGVILFRLGVDVPAKLRWLRYVVENRPEDLSQFVVITRRGVRVRRTAGS
jgi:predicted nuclease of predicted toxin-antitoxin system